MRCPWSDTSDLSRPGGVIDRFGGGKNEKRGSAVEADLGFVSNDSRDGRGRDRDQASLISELCLWLSVPCTDVGGSRARTMARRHGNPSPTIRLPTSSPNVCHAISGFDASDCADRTSTSLRRITPLARSASSNVCFPDDASTDALYDGASPGTPTTRSPSSTSLDSRTSHFCKRR